jgi:hypothetical protein
MSDREGLLVFVVFVGVTVVSAAFMILFIPLGTHSAVYPLFTEEKPHAAVEVGGGVEEVPEDAVIGTRSEFSDDNYIQLTEMALKEIDKWRSFSGSVVETLEQVDYLKVGETYHPVEVTKDKIPWFHILILASTWGLIAFLIAFDYILDCNNEGCEAKIKGKEKRGKDKT